MFVNVSFVEMKVLTTSRRYLIISFSGKRRPDGAKIIVEKVGFVGCRSCFFLISNIFHSRLLLYQAFSIIRTVLQIEKDSVLVARFVVEEERVLFGPDHIIFCFFASLQIISPEVSLFNEIGRILIYSTWE